MMNASLRSLLGVTPFVLALAACGGTVVGGGGAGSTTTVPDPSPSPPDPSIRSAIAFNDSTNCYGGGGGDTGTGTWTTGTTTWTTSGTGGTGGSTGTWSGSGGGGTGTWGGTSSGGTGGGWGGGTVTGTWTTTVTTGTWSGSSGTGGYGGGPSCGSGVTTLLIGAPPPLCSDPVLSTPCGGSFGVSIGVPPELLHPGAISLSTPAIVSYFSESGAPYGADPTSCPGGGGTFGNGVLTILAVDPASVTFSLSGTQPFELGAPSADGTYYAARCN